MAKEEKVVDLFTAYCVSEECKSHRPIHNSEVVETANGRKRLKGTCAICDKDVSKFVPTATPVGVVAVEEKPTPKKRKTKKVAAAKTKTTKPKNKPAPKVEEPEPAPEVEVIGADLDVVAMLELLRVYHTKLHAEEQVHVVKFGRPGRYVHSFTKEQLAA